MSTHSYNLHILIHTSYLSSKLHASHLRHLRVGKYQLYILLVLSVHVPSLNAILRFKAAEPFFNKLNSQK